MVHFIVQNIAKNRNDSPKIDILHGTYGEKCKKYGILSLFFWINVENDTFFVYLCTDKRDD